jgi:hypothetical protein
VLGRGEAKAALRRNDSAARPQKPPYDTHEKRASATCHIFYNSREKGQDTPEGSPGPMEICATLWNLRCV